MAPFRWFGACPGRKTQREIEQRPNQAGGTRPGSESDLGNCRAESLKHTPKQRRPSQPSLDEGDPSHPTAHGISGVPTSLQRCGTKPRSESVEVCSVRSKSQKNRVVSKMQRMREVGTLGLQRPRREWKVGRKFQGHMLPCSPPPPANRQQTDQKKEEQKREETAKAKRAT